MPNNNKHEVAKRTLRFLETMKKLDPALAREADALARRIRPARRARAAAPSTSNAA